MIIDLKKQRCESTESHAPIYPHMLPSWERGETAPGTGSREKDS